LQSASTDNMGEITVLIDHNKIQSDTWVSETSDLGNIKAKFESFGWSAWQCDGNNIVEISQEFQKMKKVTDKPKVLIADTVKGSGVSFMNFSLNPTTTYDFHSGAITDSEYDSAFNEIKSHLNKLLNKYQNKKIYWLIGKKNFTNNCLTINDALNYSKSIKIKFSDIEKYYESNKHLIFTSNVTKFKENKNSCK